jgi:hypothetical protein
MRTVRIRPTIAVLLAIAMFFTSVPANAKCKFNVDTVHSRTGEKMLWTKWNTFVLVNRGNFPLGSGVSIGDQKYFAMRVSRDVSGSKAERDSGLVVPANGKLLIKFDDNSIVELHSEEEVIGDVHGRTSEAIIKYPMDASVLNDLLKKRILNIRLSTTNEDMDYAFGKKGAKKMQKTLACI